MKSVVLSHGPIVSHLSFCLTALSERLVEMTRVTAAKEGLELLSWCFQPGAAFEWGGPLKNWRLLCVGATNYIAACSSLFLHTTSLSGNVVTSIAEYGPFTGHYS